MKYSNSIAWHKSYICSVHQTPMSSIVVCGIEVPHCAKCTLPAIGKKFSSIAKKNKLNNFVNRELGKPINEVPMTKINTFHGFKVVRCAYCSKSFKVIPSKKPRVKAHYCSQSCRAYDSNH